MITIVDKGSASAVDGMENLSSGWSETFGSGKGDIVGLVDGIKGGVDTVAKKSISLHFSVNFPNSCLH